MTTNINALPLYRATIGVSTDEDLNFSLIFTLADGVTPLSLAGIAFALSVGSEETLTTDAGGGLTISGASSNILSAFWPAASKSGWTGVHALSFAASDGAYARDVFQASSSSLTGGWGASSPLVLKLISGPATTMVSAVNALVVANTAAIAALQAANGTSAPVALTGSNAITAAGTYLVETPGSTQTLPSAATWGSGDIVIKDWTGADAPNIAVAGTIDRDPTGGSITEPGQSFWLRACAAQNSWANI